MSAKQEAILAHLTQAKDKEITLAQAVELIGREIYHNAAKHVGAVLGNMVRRRMLVRVRRGVFARPMDRLGVGPGKLFATTQERDAFFRDTNLNAQCPCVLADMPIFNQPKPTSKEPLRVCRECPKPHYENCRMCFGFGLLAESKSGVCPVIAIEAMPDEGEPTVKWKPCPACGSTINGVPAAAAEPQS